MAMTDARLRARVRDLMALGNLPDKRPRLHQAGLDRRSSPLRRPTEGRAATVQPGLMEPWALIRQIAQGHQIAHPSAEPRVCHRHCFAAASIRATTMASMFRSSRIARSLNFSA